MINFEMMGPKRAVRVGTLWLKPETIAEHLARYCHPIVGINDSNEFPYTIRGSSSAIRMHNKLFLLCTAHQIQGYSPDRVSFFPKWTNQKVVISGHRQIFVKREEGPQDEEFQDIQAIEFDPKNYNFENLSHRFFDCKDDDVWPNNTTGDFVIFGYPSKYIEYNLAGEPERARLDNLHFSQRYITAKYHSQTASRFCHQLEIQPKPSFRADGFSGGPVFHVGRRNGEVFTGFAGLIVRGSDISNRMFYVESQFCMKLLSA